jgi:hypothetical protein
MGEELLHNPTQVGQGLRRGACTVGDYEIVAGVEADRLRRRLNMRTSMRRHILSRPTWRPPCGRAQRLVSFAMLPSALLVSLLVGDSVHCEIRLFRALPRRCNLRIGLSSLGMDQVRMAQSPYARSEARSGKRSLTLCATLGSSPLWQDILHSFSFPAPSPRSGSKALPLHVGACCRGGRKSPRCSVALQEPTWGYVLADVLAHGSRKRANALRILWTAHLSGSSLS